MTTRPIPDPQGRLFLVIEVGGETARDAIAADLIRRVSAMPLFRVIKAVWWGGDGEGVEGDPVGDGTEAAITRACRDYFEGQYYGVVTDPQTHRTFRWSRGENAWKEIARV